MVSIIAGNRPWNRRRVVVVVVVVSCHFHRWGPLDSPSSTGPNIKPSKPQPQPAPSTAPGPNQPNLTSPSPESAPSHPSPSCRAVLDIGTQNRPELASKETNDTFKIFKTIMHAIAAESMFATVFGRSICS